MSNMDIQHPRAGGSEIGIYEVGKRWVKLGHDVAVISSRFKGAPKYSEVNGIRIFRKGGRYTMYLKAKNVYKRHFEGRVDLIIEDITSIPFFTYVYFKGPIIVTIHQLLKEAWFYELPLPLAAFGYLIEESLLRLYKDKPIVASSESTKKSLLEAGFDRKRIYVIPPGVGELGILHQGLHKLPDAERDRLQLLYMGSMMRYKRLADLLKAMVFVLKEVPEAKLVLAGRGHPDYIWRLKRQAVELGIKGSVYFAGIVSLEEKIHLFASLDLHIGKRGFRKFSSRSRSLPNPVHRLRCPWAEGCHPRR